MINIGLDPFPIKMGAFQLSWHGILLALAILVVCVLFFHEGEKQGFVRAELARLSVWILMAGVIGARLVDVIGNGRFYIAAPEKILKIQDGGISVTGAVLGGTLMLWVYARLNHLKWGKLADIFAVVGPIGLLIGRAGCLIMGDVPGIPMHSSWGLVYWHPASSIPPELIGVPTFPAPLALQLLDVLLLGLAVWLRRKPLREGALFAVFLMGYAIGRFFITFWQIGPPGLWGLQYIQWAAVVIFAVGLAMIWDVQWNPKNQFNE